MDFIPFLCILDMRVHFKSVINQIISSPSQKNILYAINCYIFTFILNNLNLSLSGQTRCIYSQLCLCSYVDCGEKFARRQRMLSQANWEEHFRKSKQIGNWANVEQIGETLSGKLSGCSDSRVARAQM